MSDILQTLIILTIIVLLAHLARSIFGVCGVVAGAALLFAVSEPPRASIIGGASWSASTSLSKHIPLPADGKIVFAFDDPRQNLHHQRDENFIRQLDKNVVDIFTEGRVVPITHIEEGAEEGEFSPILSADIPRLPYKRRRNELKLSLHWGQLKLMLTEIEFLTIAHALRASLEDTREIYFVYAGSAPGHHIGYLHKLFPDVHFVLYDPNKFVVRENSHIQIHQQFFLDKDARRWSTARDENKNRFIIFCSDIRTEPATNETVRENMRMQRGWFDIIAPELAMFKFRLPHEQPADAYTEYPLGDIYIQPFAPPTSTETRLICRKNAQTHRYNDAAYEEQMFYHNAVARKRYYKRPASSITVPGVDDCYDCTRFYNIVAEYLCGRDGNMPVSENVLKLMDDIQREIMHGENIRKKTIASIYKYLFMLYARCFVDCRKPSCALCRVRRGGIDDRGQKSVATNERLAAAIRAQK